MPKTDEILLARAKEMRSNPTPAEQKLWQIIRAKKFDGFKFSRQVVIAPYIVDFMARSHGLVIELDGDTHGESQDYDRQRTAFLQAKGYRVIRFTNGEIMGNASGVAEAIALALNSPPLPNQHQVNSAPRCSGYAGGITDLMLPKGERE